jgi:hypothetical protein
MGCEEIQKLSSTDPSAEYRSTPLIRSVNVKDVLGDIQTDYDNFRHGRLPQVVLNTSTLAHRCRRGRPPHHKIQPNVRFGPKATGLPRGSEMARRAKRRPEQAQQRA